MRGSSSSEGFSTDVDANDDVGVRLILLLLPILQLPPRTSKGNNGRTRLVDDRKEESPDADDAGR